MPYVVIGNFGKTKMKMINLKEIKERRKRGGLILAKLITAKNCPITLDEIKVLLVCLEDLQHLNELINYVGEKPMQIQDKRRLNRN